MATVGERYYGEGDGKIRILSAAKRLTEHMANPQGADAVVGLAIGLLRNAGVMGENTIEVFAEIVNAEAGSSGAEHEFLTGDDMRAREEGKAHTFLETLVGYSMALGFMHKFRPEWLSDDPTANIERIKREGGHILLGEYGGHLPPHADYLRATADLEAPVLLDGARDLADDFSQRMSFDETRATTLRDNAANAAVQIYARLGGFGPEPAVVGATPDVPPSTSTAREPEPAQSEEPAGAPRTRRLVSTH